MNDTLNKFIIFAAGFAAGVVVTRMVFKYYETRSCESYEDEYEEVDDSLSDVRENEGAAKTMKQDDDPIMSEYKAKLKEHNYINYSNICEAEDEENIGVKIEDDDIYEPSIISPEELGEIEDYDVIGLIYYADNVLTDESNEPISNVEELIGHDALNHFGEYNDDSVCVRNDKLKCDYEILLDYRQYSDVIKVPRPNQMEE